MKSLQFVCPTVFVVDFTTARPILARPVDPGWTDRALEASMAVVEAMASPSSRSDQFSCGWPATTTIVVVIIALVASLVVASVLAFRFRRRAIEAEASFLSKSKSR